MKDGIICGSMITGLHWYNVCFWVCESYVVGENFSSNSKCLDFKFVLILNWTESRLCVHSDSHLIYEIMRSGTFNLLITLVAQFVDWRWSHSAQVAVSSAQTLFICPAIEWIFRAPAARAFTVDPVVRGPLPGRLLMFVTLSVASTATYKTIVCRVYTFGRILFQRTAVTLTGLWPWKCRSWDCQGRQLSRALAGQKCRIYRKFLIPYHEWFRRDDWMWGAIQATDNDPCPKVPIDLLRTKVKCMPDELGADCLAVKVPRRKLCRIAMILYLKAWRWHWVKPTKLKCPYLVRFLLKFITQWSAQFG